MNVLGGDYETSILIDDFSDDMMIIMLANENSASEGASTGEQIAVVELAQDWLKTHPESCHVSDDKTRGKRPQGGGSEHVHGSVRCITAFLGDTNWGKDKVHGLMKFGGLSDEAKQVIHTRGPNEPHNKPVAGKIAVSAAPALAKLGAPAQKAIAQEIQKQKLVIPANIQKEAFKVVKEEAVEESKPEQKKEAARIVEKLEMPRSAHRE